MAIILEHITRLCFDDAIAEVENTHRTGQKRDHSDKPRHIIAKPYSRPFERKLLQAAKNTDGKAVHEGVRIVQRPFTR